jgi:integrase
MNPFPGASSYLDRHERTRWRYRHGKRTVQLPGDPAAGPAFLAAYEAAVTGAPIKKASITRHPSSAAPRTLRAAWNIVKTQTPEWQSLGAETRRVQTLVAERFLASRVAPGASLVWADVPVADLKRRHIKGIISDRLETPHAATRLIVMIRKMVMVALDEEWIEIDPTHRIVHRPKSTPFHTWTAEEMAAFEAHWPLGSTPRTAYALALWLGNRRSDVAAARWDNIDGDVFRFAQIKTGREMVLEIAPDLRAALAATPRRCETILSTRYGTPFSAKSLSNKMAEWAAAAGLPRGRTMHGLRKALGTLAAEGEATTRQIMELLGHSSIAHAELYSRAANRAKLAGDGLAKVVRLKRG